MHIDLADNSPYRGAPLGPETLADLRRIAEPSLKQLAEADGGALLVFPSRLDDFGDKIGDDHILTFDGSTLRAGNIMGFVGIGDTTLRIRSRFAKGDRDYLLHYMLQKVYAFHLFDLKYQTADEEVFDFLLFLFPHYLRRALRQGLFKEYRTLQNNDANVRGHINVARHLRRNVLFAGSVAYDSREQLYDNNLLQLIRHTIEHIRTKPFGANLLARDDETRTAVKQVEQATPTYEKGRRAKIIAANLRPFRHPYFAAYRPLQRLCLQILRRREMKYERRRDEIYGILFDGAWLWEEYLNTLLRSLAFRHPQNKLQTGRIYLFEHRRGVRYPDFIKSNFVLDAKYKHLDATFPRDDIHQLIAYLCVEQTLRGGFVYPCTNAPAEVPREQLRGLGSLIGRFGLEIAAEATSFPAFCAAQRANEQALLAKISHFAD